MYGRVKSSVALCLVAGMAWAAPKNKPNIVIIYGDDVGFGDVGVYGSKLIPTPNIDRLAADGLRFTDGHCAAATCSPSRYSLLTGKHGFRDGVGILAPSAPLSISTEILTLPKLLQQVGYMTGVVGKWHLGIGQKGVAVDWNDDVLPGPLEIGFKRSFLLPSTNDRVPCVYLNGHRVVNLDPADPLHIGRSTADVEQYGGTPYPDGRKNPEAMTYYKNTHGHNQSVINGIGRVGYMAGGESALWNDETMGDELVKQALKYIKMNKDKPFFLYFASPDIHVPRAPHPRFHGTTKLGYRGDAMVQFDWSTGEIMKALEEHGLTENTIVIFSSDNGPVYDDGYDDGTTVKTSSEEVDHGHDASGIYKGGKYQIYEGGTRVPFIIRWPARIKPGVSDALVNQIDFIASFAALFDLDLPDNEAVDSRNMLSAFLGEDQVGLDFMLEEAIHRRALRRGDWKYIAPAAAKKKKGKQDAIPKGELYNLKNDPSESKNRIADYPEKGEALAKELTQLMDAGRVRK